MSFFSYLELQLFTSILSKDIKNNQNWIKQGKVDICFWEIFDSFGQNVGGGLGAGLYPKKSWDISNTF